MLSWWLWLSTRWCPLCLPHFLAMASATPLSHEISLWWSRCVEGLHSVSGWPWGTPQCDLSWNCWSVSFIDTSWLGARHWTWRLFNLSCSRCWSDCLHQCASPSLFDSETIGPRTYSHGWLKSIIVFKEKYGAQPGDVWQTCVSPCCISHWEHACGLWTSVSGCFYHTCASASYAQQRNWAAGPWICRNCLLDYKGVRCRPFSRFVDHRLQWQRWPLMLLHLLFHQLLMKLIWPDLYLRISPAVCFGVGKPPLLSHLGVRLAKNTVCVWWFAFMIVNIPRAHLGGTWNICVWRPAAAGSIFLL